MGTNHRSLPKIQTNTLCSNKTVQPVKLQVTARAEHWSYSTIHFISGLSLEMGQNEKDFLKIPSKELANKPYLRCYIYSQYFENVGMEKRLSVSEQTFPLTLRQNQCQGKQRASLSVLVNDGGLVSQHQTDESPPCRVSSELTML